MSLLLAGYWGGLATLAAQRSRVASPEAIVERLQRQPWALSPRAVLRPRPMPAPEPAWAPFPTPRVLGLAQGRPPVVLVEGKKRPPRRVAELRPALTLAR